MKRKLLSALFACTAAMAIAAPANAATYLKYVLTGGYAAEWFIDLPITPDEAGNGLGIGFYDVDGTFPGSNPIYYADVRFYNLAQGGGLTLTDHYSGDVLLLSASGPQLYTGDEETTPLLLTGSFDFTGGAAAYHLEVTSVDVAAPIPEPESWALLLVGFAVVGSALRARANRVAFS